MKNTLIKSRGTLRFGNTNVVVDIDDQIVQYYYSLIPKYYYAQRQMYRGHITVIRTGFETWPKSIDYTGRTIFFYYENVVRFTEPYFYLNVYSDDIGNLRRSLGLTYNRWTFTCFHITVGNIKK